MTTESNTSKAPSEALHDLLCLARSVCRRSVRYWPAIPVSIALGIVAFFLAPKLRPPVYKSEIVLAIREGFKTDGATEAPEGQETTRMRNARLKALVYSRPALKAVVEQEQIDPKAVADFGMAKVVDDVGSFVGFSVGDGNTMAVSFSAEDPYLAQRVARGLGKQLASTVKNEASERAGATRKFLEDEAAKLAETLRTKEAEYAEFVTLHPEFALDRVQTQGAAALARSTTPAAAPNDSGSALRRQADRLRARLAQIAKPGATRAPSSAATEPELTPESREAIAAAQQEVQQAESDLAAKQTRLTPLHPDVVQAKARLAGARERLRGVRAAAQRLAKPAARDSALPVPAETEQGLRKQLRNVEATLLHAANDSGTESGADNAREIVGLETRWTALTRSVESARDQYESMQRRLFNAILIDTAQSTGGGARIDVLEDAYFPKRPIARNPTVTGILALAAVVGLGLACMLGLGFLDPRLVSQWDLEQAAIAPIALFVPSLPKTGGRASSG